MNSDHKTECAKAIDYVSTNISTKFPQYPQFSQTFKSHCIDEEFEDIDVLIDDFAEGFDESVILESITEDIDIRNGDKQPLCQTIHQLLLTFVSLSTSPNSDGVDEMVKHKEPQKKITMSNYKKYKKYDPMAKYRKYAKNVQSYCNSIESLVEECDYFNISFKNSYSEILAECERVHRCNVDKLRLNELCVSCNGYYQELDFYSKAMENNTFLNSMDLLPIKYILLSYLVHSEIEYYSKNINTFPKYQVIMDDWNKYALTHSKLKRSLNILKKQINTLNMKEFINLLFKLQPWMTAQDLCSIIQFQVKNNPLCTGCGHCGASKYKHNIIWCCHMALKIIFLLYFTVNLWADSMKYWFIIHGFINAHHVISCDWYWNVSKDAQYIHFFGNQIIPIHVVNEMRKKKGKDIDEETLAAYCMKPPIVSIETFETIKTGYLKELKEGHDVIHQGNPIHFDFVFVVNELGKFNICIL